MFTTRPRKGFHAVLNAADRRFGDTAKHTHLAELMRLYERGFVDREEFETHRAKLEKHLRAAAGGSARERFMHWYFDRGGVQAFHDQAEEIAERRELSRWEPKAPGPSVRPAVWPIADSLGSGRGAAAAEQFGRRRRAEERHVLRGLA